MRENKIKRIYILSFIFALHIALSAYVNSSFLTGIMSEKFVGILYTISSLLTLFFLSKSVNILKDFGNRKLTLAFLSFNIISLVGLITSNNPYIIGASFIIFTSTNTLVLFCIDIFIEHFSNPKKTGKTRGLYLTIVNIAWMLSPLIAAFIITEVGGYRFIYIISFIMVSIMAIGLVFSVKTFKDKTYTKTPFLETFRYLKNNKHLLAITSINFLLHFFFAWMVVYTPIYLIEHLKFTWEQLGVIFTIMLIPFVILGYPIGILIDKYHLNKRKILYLAFTIIIISTISISFINSISLVVWSIILFATRVGASMIETTGEIYFFSHTNAEDAGMLSIYRDMLPIAYIVAPIVATVVFFIFPFKYLFIILSIIMCIGFYIIPKLKHNHANTIPNQNQ
jgi:MFS family permease